MDESVSTAFYKRYKRLERAAIEQLEKDSEYSDDYESRCSSDQQFIYKFHNPDWAEEDEKKLRVAKTPFVNHVRTILIFSLNSLLLTLV